MITESDKIHLEEKGISIEQFQKQLNSFKEGFPFLELAGAASVEKGILVVSPDEEKKYLDDWDKYKSSVNRKIIKFVPASGAASRMFKDLFEFLEMAYDVPTSAFEKAFFDGLTNFAFYNDLDKACEKSEKKNIKELLVAGNYKAIVENLLLPKGLNYGNLPKGLLRFHRYEDGERTPVEEHLVEGSLYAKNDSGTVNLHFTVSPEHRIMFEKLVRQVKSEFEKKLESDYRVSFSVQKPSTDTIAADEKNEPFREDGMLLFRPGGHGALIENLNELDADVVFVKNIDNTVPDKYKSTETKYKKILAGVLVDAQSKIFE